MQSNSNRWLRHYLIAFACLALWAQPAQAQVSLAQACILESGDILGAVGQDIVFTSPTTVGNHILVAVGWGGVVGLTVTVTDDGSNTYSQTLANYAGSAAGAVHQKAAPVTTTSQTVTVTMSGATTGTADYIAICEVVNLVDPIAVDATSTTATTGVQTHDTLLSVTTTTDNAFLLGQNYCSNGTYTADGDYSAVSTFTFGMVATDILSATATQNMETTSAANETCTNALVAYQGEGGAAPSRAKHCLLLGVCE